MNEPIRYCYIHSISPKLELSNYNDIVKKKRHAPLVNEWPIWRFINNTQVYTNEYLGRNIEPFGNFDEL